MTKQTLAYNLLNDGLVTRVDTDNFLVGEKQYKVRRENNDKYFYEFFCSCPAWKFDKDHDCKHCIAVRLFEKQGN